MVELNRYTARMLQLKRWVLAISIAAVVACGGKKDDKPTGGSGGAAPKPAAAVELASTADPAGVTWTSLEQPWGTVEIPTGDGWEMVEGQLQGKDGTVVMLQAQGNITPDLIDDYLVSYEDVQKRDAPKYAGKGNTRGTVSGAPAVRVEGTFDNGTRFVTRDYLLFTKGQVVLLSARAPEPGAALAGVIDHMARSAKVK